MIFVGLEKGSNAYHLWDKRSSRIVVSVNARFDESVFPAKTIPNSTNLSCLDYDTLISRPEHPSPNPPGHTVEPIQPPTNAVASPQPQRTTDFANQEVSVTDDTDMQPVLEPPDTTPPEPARRSTRAIREPTRYCFIAEVDGEDSDGNPSYEKAMAGPDQARWLKAMESEWESFCVHNVDTLVEPPKDANIWGGMWVLSRPRDEHHRIIKHKVRYVISGNHQVYGLDFEDTYASVGKSDSMRIILATASAMGFHIIQFDITTAFLNGDMRDTVYCCQVRGFKNLLHPHHVWLLNQSLYGSWQGARRWQQKFEAKAAKFGLHPTHSDPVVYILKTSKGILIVHLHVDDSLVLCSSLYLLDNFVVFLDSVFTVKWTKSPSLYLGIKIGYDSS